MVGRSALCDTLLHFQIELDVPFQSVHRSVFLAVLFKLVSAVFFCFQKMIPSIVVDTDQKLHSQYLVPSLEHVDASFILS